MKILGVIQACYIYVYGFWHVNISPEFGIDCLLDIYVLSSFLRKSFDLPAPSPVEKSAFLLKSR
jgi:hypothetical protein